MTVEHFRNRRTGITWGVNPGTPEHARMVRMPDEFERVEPEPAPKPEPKPARKSTKRTPKPSETSEEAD